MKRHIICMVVSLIILITAATASNASKELLKPGMGSKFIEDSGADFAKSIDYILGGAIAAFIIAGVVFISKGGILWMKNSTEMGDPREKAHASNAVVAIIFIIAVVVLALKLIPKFFGYY